MLNTKCHKTLTKTLVNRSSPSNQESRFISTWFSKFLPLEEQIDNMWAQRNGLRGQRTNNSSKRKKTTQEERTRSLGMRETTKANAMSRSPETWATTQHNGDKNAWSLKKRHKGLNTDHGQAKTQVNRRLLKKRQRGSTPPAQEHKTHKLPLNTWTRAKEHTKLTLNSWDREKSTPSSQAPPKHMH
jgi:hypothetical protein